MGKVTGFIEYQRETPGRRPPSERVQDWFEIYEPLPEDKIRKQGARCMDCGVPFCHTGCPVSNIIPDWNDLVWHGRWHEANRVLHATNNFPEFTGRICPAPCESACVLGINEPAVTIKNIEKTIVDRAWEEGWIVPERPARATGKKIAVVGSGPAGMAAAQQLARAGHAVTLFEKADRIGGLLRYGIPDFKMEKHLIDRRMRQMEAEGVVFRTNVEVGVTVSMDMLQADYDAVVLSGGAEEPRDLAVAGRELDGIHFAMDFLTQQNKRVAGDSEAKAAPNGTLSAKGKHVVVIGGGDTGSDCIGTSNRHGAASVTQFEILPQPPAKENKLLVWPDWPLKLRTSSSQQEGCERDWSVQTKRALGENGKVTALECVRVDWQLGDGGQMKLVEVPGSEFTLKADLVLLAMGFVGPRKAGLVEQAGVELDPRGNVKAPVTSYQTSKTKIFSCGDMRRGQSLVVWAIREGRQCARGVDEFLMGSSELPR